MDTLEKWQKRLEEYLSQIKFSDKSHDLAHFRRVWDTARQITSKDCDLLVILAGAYLHDIVSYPKNHPSRSRSSHESALMAQKILIEIGFPNDKVAAVMHAIEAHSYSANIKPESIEAKVLQDADRMEALGAIGLARTFYTAGLLGSKLFHDKDPFAKHRSLDDSKYAVDHFEAKLMKLPKTMQTAAGKEIANKRLKVLQYFLEELSQELGHDLAGGKA